MKFRGLALSLLLVAACGGDGNGDGPPSISPDAVFDYYGLGDGNCYDYRFSIGGVTFQTARVEVSAALAEDRYQGRTVRQWTLTRQGGADTGDLVRVFEFVGGELRLLFESVRDPDGGTRQTRLFDDPQTEGGGRPPVVIDLVRGTGGTSLIAPPGEFSTTTRPQTLIDETGMRLSGDDVGEEFYEYDVFSELATETDVGGTEYTGTQFRVTIDRGGETFNFREFIAPGIGFVSFEDYSGTNFQLEEFTVTRSDGSTEGDLTCP